MSISGCSTSRMHINRSCTMLLLREAPGLGAEDEAPVSPYLYNGMHNSSGHAKACSHVLAPIWNHAASSYYVHLIPYNLSCDMCQQVNGLPSLCRQRSCPWGYQALR